MPAQLALEQREMMEQWRTGRIAPLLRVQSSLPLLCTAARLPIVLLSPVSVPFTHSCVLVLCFVVLL